MTSSVNVYLIDASPATRAAAQAIAFPHQYGHFDGMTDCYEYSNSRKDIPQVKFVFVENSMSDALRAEVYAFVRGYWAGGDALPESYEAARNMRLESANCWVSDAVYQMFSGHNGAFWAKKIDDVELVAVTPRGWEQVEGGLEHMNAQGNA